jgi:hypothetical protein
MKFRLTRQTIVNPNIPRIITREMKKQKTYVFSASKKDLKEIYEVSGEIRRHGLPKYLVRKKLPKALGYGIFLHPKAKPILKGQVIAPYAGEVSILPQNMPDDSAYAFATVCDFHLPKEEQALLDDKLFFHPRRLYFVNVDALKKGNFTRFINHSEKPNVVVHFVRIPSNSFGLKPAPMEIVYYAKRTIHPGEQLLVCYEDGEKTYWAPLNIKPFPMTAKTFQLSSSLKLIHRQIAG